MVKAEPALCRIGMYVRGREVFLFAVKYDRLVLITNNLASNMPKQHSLAKDANRKKWESGDCLFCW